DPAVSGRSALLLIRTLLSLGGVLLAGNWLFGNSAPRDLMACSDRRLLGRHARRSGVGYNGPGLVPHHGLVTGEWMSMTPKRRAAVFGVASMATSLCLTAIFLFLATRRCDRVVWQDCQPPTVDYHSFDPYCLSVVEGSLEWTGFPLSVTRRFYLFIGRGVE